MKMAVSFARIGLFPLTVPYPPSSCSLKGKDIKFNICSVKMGCVYTMYLRLTNSSFYLIWARMYHFEARLMVLIVHSDKNLMRMRRKRGRLQCFKI